MRPNDEDGTYEQIKNYNEFHPDGGICYVPECGDYTYYYKDYLEIAKGNVKLAEILFDLSDWQHPETLLDEFIGEGEVEEDGNTFKFIEQ